MKNILVCLHLAVGEEDLIIEEDHMEEGAGMLGDVHFIGLVLSHIPHSP